MTRKKNQELEAYCKDPNFETDRSVQTADSSCSGSTLFPILSASFGRITPW